MSDKLARAQHRHVAEPQTTPMPTADPGSTAQIRLKGSHMGVDRTQQTPESVRTFEPGSTAAIPVVGRHGGVDRTREEAYASRSVMLESAGAATLESADSGTSGSTGAATSAPTPALTPKRKHAQKFPPGSTAAIPIVSRHGGIDRTRNATDEPNPSPLPPAAERITASSVAVQNPRRTAGHEGDDLIEAVVSTDVIDSGTDVDIDDENRTAAVGSSAALISVCVMISRITGFVRTWAMAFALGSTLLSSSYQVANNLPNMLYELVVGGMLVTAFLPVYMSVKKKLGQKAGNEYASNLLSLVVIFLGIVALLCMAFPATIIYTQSFLSDQTEMTTSVFFFQFFAIQIVFYGVSAIVSGLLNANRDYLWSSIAPVANNFIVIATFLAYAFVAPSDPQLALLIIAIGNPLGVFVQMAIQIPALKRNGIRIRPRINFRDPALRETLSIGIPAVIVMLCSFLVVSVQNAAALSFADAGPSILAYARLWFTLPYAFLAVPITTAMFTELSDMQAEGDTEGVKRGIISGTNQILFFMIPFALYLMVFATPLITLYHAGAFSTDSVAAIASYLAVFALCLPFYGVNTYLQKIFSSIRKMTVFAAFNIAAALVQIALTMGASFAYSSGMVAFPIESIAIAELFFYLVSDLCLFIYLRRRFGAFGLRSTARAFGCALLFGGLGAAAGGGVFFTLTTFVAPLSGGIAQALGYIVAGGLVSLAVTFGLSIKLHIPEAAFVSTIVGKVAGKLGRR